LLLKSVNFQVFAWSLQRLVARRSLSGEIKNGTVKVFLPFDQLLHICLTSIDLASNLVVPAPRGDPIAPVYSGGPT
jgi:hypothetical protein